MEFKKNNLLCEKELMENIEHITIKYEEDLLDSKKHQKVAKKYSTIWVLNTIHQKPTLRK